MSNLTSTSYLITIVLLVTMIIPFSHLQNTINDRDICNDEILNSDITESEVKKEIVKLKNEKVTGDNIDKIGEKNFHFHLS